MKKLLIILIHILFLSFIGYATAGYPKIAIVVHAPLYPPSTWIHKNVIRKANELNSAGIAVEVKWKEISTQRRYVADLLNDMKGAIEDGNQILITAFYGYAPKDNRHILKFYNRYPDKIFIIPWSNEEFEKSYSFINPNNVFIIPEPIEEILSLLEQNIGKYGYDFKLLRDELRKRQAVVQNKYVGWKRAISKSAGEAINSWEKITRGEVTPAAYSYLTKSYSSETIKYAKALPDVRADLNWLKEPTPEEINGVLNAYYKKTGKKKVTVGLLKTSGVNGCESLPCKRRCCDEYRKKNHECLHRINCD